MKIGHLKLNQGELDLTPGYADSIEITQAFLMLFPSALTSNIVTIVHDMFVEHFGDISDTINPPLVDFKGVIYA